MRKIVLSSQALIFTDVSQVQGLSFKPIWLFRKELVLIAHFRPLRGHLRAGLGNSHCPPPWAPWASLPPWGPSAGWLLVGVGTSSEIVVLQSQNDRQPQVGTDSGQKTLFRAVSVPSRPARWGSGPRTSECDCIRRQDVYRGDKGKMRSLGGTLIRKTGVLIRRGDRDTGSGWTAGRGPGREAQEDQPCPHPGL